MTVQTNVVIYDAGTQRHLPIAPGDLIDRSLIDFAPTSLAFNAGTGDLTATFADGSTKVANLGALAADKFLASSSFDPLTSILTLTMTDASTYTVNLADLIKVSTANSTSIKLVGDGTATSPLVGTLDLTVAAIAPPIGDNGTITTKSYTTAGTPANVLLGDPDGWTTITVAGVARKVPYWA